MLTLLPKKLLKHVTDNLVMNAMKLEKLRTKTRRKQHLRLTYGEDLVKYNSETPAVLKKSVVSTPI